MITVLFGDPSSGKSTAARHIAKNYGQYIFIKNEGVNVVREGETTWTFPKGVNPLDWLKCQLNAPENKEAVANAKSIVIDSMTGVNDAYEPIALELCFLDDKLKKMHPAEKAKMKLGGVPYGGGPAMLGTVVKEFIEFIVSISSRKHIIATSHTMLITVVGSDQLTSDIKTVSIGGKSEKSAAGRNCLLQHADVLAYIDSTPEKRGDTLKPSRKIIVGQSGNTVAKYRSELFGKDEFFTPEDYYDINGKDNLTKTIKELFTTPA